MDVEKRIEQLEKEYEQKLILEKRKFSEELKKVEEDRDRKTAVMMDMNKIITQNKVHLQSTQTEVQRLVKLLEDEKKGKLRLEFEIDKLENVNFTAQEGMKRLRKRSQGVDTLKKDNERFENRIIDFKTQLKSAENQALKQKSINSKLKEKLINQESYIKKCKTSINQHQTTIKSLRKELLDQEVNFKEEKEMLEERIRKSSRNLKNTKNKLTLKSRENGRKVSNQKKLIKKYQEELIQLKSEARISSTKQHNQNVDHPSNLSPKKAKTLSIQLKTMKRESGKLSSEMNELRKLLETKEIEIKGLKSTNTENVINSRKDIVEQLNRQIEENKSKKIQLEKLLAECKKDNEILKKNIKELEGTINTREEKILSQLKSINLQKEENKKLMASITKLRAQNRSRKKR